jgi:hypothetical protein
MVKTIKEEIKATPEVLKDIMEYVNLQTKNTPAGESCTGIYCVFFDEKGNHIQYIKGGTIYPTKIINNLHNEMRNELIRKLCGGI